MLCIYHGADSYSRTEAVTHLKQDLDSDQMLSANTVSLEAAHLNLSALLAVCDTVPFLSAHRLVIVSNLLAQSPRSTRARAARRPASEAGGREGAAEELAAYIPRMPPTTTLLLIEEALSDDHPGLKLLSPLGKVLSCRPLNSQQLQAWILARGDRLGTSFEPGAIRMLVQSVGSDLWTMAGEVDKLALYASGRAVTEADVRALVAAAQVSNIFSMIDAIADGQLEQALLQLDLLLQHGAAGPYLLTMIARLYRQIIVAEDMLKSGERAEAIRKALELRSEGALRRVLQQARRFDAATLAERLERILEADLSIKRGQVEERVALQLLVAELAPPARRAGPAALRE